MATYAASKAAVVMFSRSAAISLGAHNIRVNCIAPGHIDTPILASALTGLTEEQKEQAMRVVQATMMSTQPLKRQGMPADVAEVAVNFASDRSAFVTGTVLPVDGGTVAGSPPHAATLDDLSGARAPAAVEPV
jgi:NAD(P)-dependent dehydrogenase (short-subunit alcohol dehydrogenase family)